MKNDPRMETETYISVNNGERAYALATIVRTQNATSAKAGAKAVVTGDGEIIGWLGSSCVQGAVRKVAKDVLSSGRSKLIRVKPNLEVTSSHDSDGVELYKSGCPSQGTSDIFVEAVMPAAQLIICGNSYVARSLAELAASSRFRVVRMAPGLGEEEAGGSHVLAGFDVASLDASAERYWVVATQGARDRDALKAALAEDAIYVSFVGSRKKGAALAVTLRSEGVDAGRLDALVCPAGLDLGAVEPAEIAVSILAQIIQVRRASGKAAAGEVADEIECA